VAIAKYLGLVALRLVDPLILPINTTQYALELGSYLIKVKNQAEAQGLASELDLRKLGHAIAGLQHASALLDKERVSTEKYFDKQYRKLGSKFHRRHHRLKKCAKRRWKKLRNWIKSVFGVKTEDESVHHDSAHKRHAESDHPDMKRRFNAEGERNEKRSFPNVRLGLAAGDPQVYDRVVEANGLDNEPRAAAEVEEARFEKRDSPKPRIGLAGGDPHISGRAVKGEIVGNEARDLPFRIGLTGAHVNKDPKYEARHIGGEDDKLVVRRPIRSCSKSTRDAKIMAAAFDTPSLVGVHSKLPKKFLKARKAVVSVNRRLRLFEQGFISEGGIKDREWYRHLGVAPGKWLGYGATTFPALTEALDEKNVTLAIRETERLAKLIDRLTATLIQY